MTSTGALVIAHGSRNTDWVNGIEAAVRNSMSKISGIPVDVGFLELVPGKSIADGVYSLQRRGVKRILIIPLFVTMGSTHLEEIQYALGLLENSRIPTDLEPIQPTAELIWCSPLEDHPLLLEVLGDRVQALSSQPDEEVLLLIGHGSEVLGFKEKWEELLQHIGRSLRTRFGFKGFSYAFLKGSQIARRAKALSSKNRVIVLPIFLNEGYFTQTVIPSKLDSIKCVYNGQTYLPHPLITDWICQTISEKLEKLY